MRKFKVEVDCPNCANELAKELSKISGIKKCDINFTIKEMLVEFEDGANENLIISEMKKVAKELDDEFEIYE